MSKILAITHNDRFHADDVFAAATLKLVYGDKIEFKRTRDEEEIEKGDMVFDVGHIYDQEKNRFDHHQTEGAGKRDNGIPYASFGLVWKKFGEELCNSSEAAKKVDENLVQVVDAGDTGFSICKPVLEDVTPTSFDRTFLLFGSTWKEEENYDKAFFEVVEIAQKILEREIINAKHKVEAKPIVLKAYEQSTDKRLLVLDQYLPFRDLAEKTEELLFVISPSKNKDQWRISAVQEKEFTNRKDLPKEWAGLRDEELEKITGIKDSVFCHRSLFLAVAKTKESAIELAKLALEN